MMKQLRNNVIRAGLDMLSLTGAYHLLRPVFGGVGAIYMLHHVRPQRDAAFQPNRHLEITPRFLRETLVHLRQAGVDIISIDEAHRRMKVGDFSRRFACFTADDGYRDNRDHALPVMREFDAPLCVYVASDFAQGVGRLWWVTLERIVAAADAVEVTTDGVATTLETATPTQKAHAFATLHEFIRALPTEDDIRREVSALCARHGVDEDAISRELCLSWDELQHFAADPLVTIGAHTISHCNLAKQSEATARDEIAISRSRIEAAIGRRVAHFAYPYGDRAAAAAREFALTRDLGFATAVTTRPGMLFAASADHMTALPRISLNGNYQDRRYLPVLTSGAATAVWNGFRRVDAA